MADLNLKILTINLKGPSGIGKPDKRRTTFIDIVKDTKPDIILVSEPGGFKKTVTELNKDRESGQKFITAAFTKNHAAVLVKENLIQDKKELETETERVAISKIKLKGTSKTFLVAAYHGKYTSVKKPAKVKATQELFEVLKSIASDAGNGSGTSQIKQQAPMTVLLGGDFNYNIEKEEGVLVDDIASYGYAVWPYQASERRKRLKKDFILSYPTLAGYEEVTVLLDKTTPYKCYDHDPLFASLTVHYVTDPNEEQQDPTEKSQKSRHVLCVQDCMELRAKLEEKSNEIEQLRKQVECLLEKHNDLCGKVQLLDRAMIASSK